MWVFSAGVVVAILAQGREQRRSPHETVNETLAGKQITISYGRPSLHGRKIMGGLVPYGDIWRTGADEATTLTTAADLTIGGASIPAGQYTLWTLPAEAGWKLVINKETGQWGTNYHAAQDLVRVGMRTSNVSRPVEEFTIAWRNRSEREADLIMEWENTRVSVPVQVN